MTRLSSQSSTRLATAEATHEATLRTSLLTRRRSATRFAMSALLMSLLPRVQRGEEGQGCTWRDRAAGTEQGARDLPELCQRRVALERLRERRGARVADLIVPQAAARRGGLGMLVARQGHPAFSRARATYSSVVSIALIVSASESAAAPASPIRLWLSLLRGEKGQGCSW
jgi:hypothetical protein